MEEETIGSFIIRYMLSSGNEDIKKICSPLFNDAKKAWNIFPCSNEIFLSYSKIILANTSFANISKNHSLIPLLKITGSPRLEDTFKNYFMTCMGTQRVKHFRQQTVSIGEKLTSSIRYCTYCFEEQLYDKGFSWFKREWQITGMTHCLKHKSKLVIPTCNICNTNNTPIRQIESAIHGKCTYCYARLPTSTYESIFNPVAEWSLRLLNSNLPTFSVNLVRFLVRYSHFKLVGIKESNKTEIAKFFSELFEPSSNTKTPILNSLGRLFTSPRDYEYRMTCLLETQYSFSDDYNPLICLIHPLTLAFSNFDDFKYFLNEITYEMQIDGQFTRMLDLKSDIDDVHIPDLIT